MQSLCMSQHYAKSKTNKKAKQAAELPSADGGVSENEAWAVGSQEPTKGAMNSGKDEHSFWRNFLADKQFNWLSLQESHTCTSSAKEGHIEGWLSKYQVAAQEKLPAEN